MVKNYVLKSRRTVHLLPLFIFINGLINKVAAPVVPIKLDIKAPINNNKQFTRGVPFLFISKYIPPEIIYKTAINIINCRYSIIDNIGVFMSCNINKSENNVIPVKDKIIFVKFFSQNFSDISGTIATDNSKNTNGNIYIALIYLC